jgi:hypothetical protein
MAEAVGVVYSGLYHKHERLDDARPDARKYVRPDKIDRMFGDASGLYECQILSQFCRRQRTLCCVILATNFLPSTCTWPAPIRYTLPPHSQ